MEEKESANRSQHIRQRTLTVNAIRAQEAIGLRVLDMCCGTGKVTGNVLSLPNVREVVALDISGRALSRLVLKLAHHPCLAKLSVAQADVSTDDLLEAWGTFDVVICLDALHHVARLETAFHQVGRVLRANGVFIGNYIRRESLAKHVSNKSGMIKHWLMYLLAEALRLVSFIGLVWRLAGKLGAVRLVPRWTWQIETVVSDAFRVTDFDLSDYYWFAAHLQRCNEGVEQGLPLLSGSEDAQVW